MSPSTVVRAHSKQVGWFVFFGVANTLVYLLVFAAAREWLGLPDLVSALAACAFAASVHFSGNFYVTFHNTRGRMHRAIGLYLLVYGGGVVYNLACVAAGSRLASNPYYGVWFFMITWPVISFFLSRTVVFKGVS